MSLRLQSEWNAHPQGEGGGSGSKSGLRQTKRGKRAVRYEGDGVFVELRRGDCLELLQTIEAETVDIVVTSPPYNIGVAYGAYDDFLPRTDYLAWIDRWAEEVARVLRPDGSLFLNVGCKPTDQWVPLQVAATVSGARDITALHTPNRFALQNTIHWVKSISIDPESIGQQHLPLDEPLSVGHYKPINSPRFLNDTHEYIFHFSKSGRASLDWLALGVPYQDKSNVRRWKGARNDRRCRGNCWFLPYDTIQSRDDERPHPATFPVSLPEWAVRAHGIERAKLVVDPFLGIGTSAIACATLGVSFVGFEIDESYYAESLSRFRKWREGTRRGA